MGYFLRSFPTIIKMRIFKMWKTDLSVLVQNIYIYCYIKSSLKGFTLIYHLSYKHETHMLLDIYWKLKTNRKSEACLQQTQNTFNHFGYVYKRWRFINLSKMRENACSLSTFFSKGENIFLIEVFFFSFQVWIEP